MLAQLKYKQISSTLRLMPLKLARRTLDTVLDYVKKGEKTFAYHS